MVNQALTELNNTPMCDISPLGELSGVSGGTKQMWLKENCREVMDFYSANGRIATMIRFYITKDRTLDNLIALDSLFQEGQTAWDKLPGGRNTTGGGGRKIKKGSPIPPGWCIFKHGRVYDYIKPSSEISELHGGQKMIWLKQHKEEIEDYYYEHGEESTLTHFSLGRDTLEAILGGHNVGRFNRVDKLELQLESYREDVRDLRREHRELKEAFANFEEYISKKLGKNILALIVQGLLNEPEALHGESTPNLIEAISKTGKHWE